MRQTVNWSQRRVAFMYWRMGQYGFSHQYNTNMILGFLFTFDTMMSLTGTSHDLFDQIRDSECMWSLFSSDKLKIGKTTSQFIDKNTVSCYSGLAQSQLIYNPVLIKRVQAQVTCSVESVSKAAIFLASLAVSRWFPGKAVLNIRYQYWFIYCK